MRTSSSLRSSAGTLRRIPQALSTVTTIEYSISVLQLLVSYNTASGKRCCNDPELAKVVNYESSYNTASGKRCCNFMQPLDCLAESVGVTIPQAVSAVATATYYNIGDNAVFVTIPQAVSAVATRRSP